MPSRKPNTGAFFVNDRKEQENQPDFTGRLDVDGKEYRLAGWKNTSQKGVKYISLKLSDPDDFQQKAAPSPVGVQDDIPF